MTLNIQTHGIYASCCTSAPAPRVLETCLLSPTRAANSRMDKGKETSLISNEHGVMKELNSSLIKAATGEQNPCSSKAQAAVCSRRLPGKQCQERHQGCRPGGVLITGLVGPRAPTPAALLGVRRDALNIGLAHLATVFLDFRFAEETGCGTQWKPLVPSSPTPQLGPRSGKGPAIPNLSTAALSRRKARKPCLTPCVGFPSPLEPN